eukprot:3685790-Rhodomonas_salina.1
MPTREQGGWPKGEEEGGGRTRQEKRSAIPTQQRLPTTSHGFLSYRSEDEIQRPSKPHSRPAPGLQFPALTQKMLAQSQALQVVIHDWS